jgi:serine/threonine-protein kinase
VYAAPEQLKNRKAQIDTRSDQFALGIVFLQLLLGGVHPFDPTIAGGDSIVQNILVGRWARDRIGMLGLSPAWTALAARLLAAEPFGRFRNSSTLMEALTALRARTR